MTAIEQQIAKIREWIEALRSGKYLQGQQALCRTYGEKPSDRKYCCLGVACDLIDPNLWISTRLIRWDGDQPGAVSDTERNYLEYPDLPLDNGSLRDFTYSGHLPPRLRAQCYGIDNTVEHYLIGMNDAGKSFAEIADYLEKTVIPEMLQRSDR